jgi:hypothetical protein
MFIFALIPAYRWDLELTHPPSYIMLHGGIATKREKLATPPSGVGVKNAWNCTPASACLHVLVLNPRWQICLFTFMLLEICMGRLFTVYI